MMPTAKPGKLQAFAERNLLSLQLAVSLLVGLGLAFGASVEPLASWLAPILADDRRDLYSAVSSVAGALLGFVMAAAAIILAAVDSPRLDRLRESTQYSTLWRVFVSTSKWLGLLTIGSLAGIVLDSHADPRPAIFFVLSGLATLCVLRFATCVWILERVTTALAPKPAADGGGRTA